MTVRSCFASSLFHRGCWLIDCPRRCWKARSKIPVNGDSKRRRQRSRSPICCRGELQPSSNAGGSWCWRHASQPRSATSTAMLRDLSGSDGLRSRPAEKGAPFYSHKRRYWCRHAYLSSTSTRARRDAWSARASVRRGAAGFVLGLRDARSRCTSRIASSASLQKEEQQVY